MKSLSPRARLVLEIALVVVVCGLGVGMRLGARLDRTWAFAGSDSVGYAKLGHELRAHGRYALGPPPEPLAWVRPPLYPIFLALVFPSGEVFKDSWTALFVCQFLFDLLSGLCAWAMARKLAGPVAGLLALAMTELNPFTPLFALAMLTETLATVLTTAAITTIMLGVRRPRLWWPIAGALVALATLLRPDGIFAAVGFAPALVLVVAPRREKLIWAGAALAGFFVVFAPWPIRNLVQFGTPHPLGGRIDRFTRPVENWEGYWAWLRSWSRDYEGMTTPTTCFYDSTCNPRVLDDLRRRGAYRDVDDEKEVRPLIEQRFQKGLTPEISAAFQKLADARRRAHPILVEIWFPLTRSWYMWSDKFIELLQGRRPWIWQDLFAWQKPLSTLQAIAWMLLGAWLCLNRRTRSDASVPYAVIVVRTLVLGFTFYSMPRYSIELMPTAYTLIAAGAVSLVERARQWPRQ